MADDNKSNNSIFKLEVKQIGEPTLVPPAEDTPKGLYFLSNLDQLPLYVGTVYCFKSESKSNENAAQVIKNALAKLLVHHYPAAGRFAVTPEGKYLIECTGDGAMFVEAEANCGIEDIGDMPRPDPVTFGKLVYDISGPENRLQIPLIFVQVTKFKCGGFSLGLAISHSLHDGVAAAEFLNSWSDLARGLPLKIPLFLDRTILKARNPPQIEFPHHEFAEIEGVSDTNKEEMVTKSFCFDPEKIDRLKNLVMRDEKITKCTTFEALTGFVWKSRCQALRMKHDEKTRLLFSVDGRSRFNPPLPKGYAGNAVFSAYAICKAGDLLENNLSYSVELVQEAVKMLTDSYMRSTIDYLEVTKPGLAFPGTLFIVTWSRLSFHTIDFGWGAPIKYGPNISSVKEIILFMSHGSETKSINTFVTLPISAMKTFEKLMQI